MFAAVVGWFFGTKIGNALGFAVIFAAVVLWVYLSGRREGASEQAVEQTEKALEVLRRMRDANASTSRDRNDTVDSLRDGEF